MDEQTSLVVNTKSKRELVDELKTLYFSNFSKIISDFGSLDSKILILGISPVKTHYDSFSKSCFSFDTNLKQTVKSGGVLCKTFDRLGINIDSVLWDNVYKVPEEMLTEESKDAAIKYITEFIKIINPKIIVCLGNDCMTIINRLTIDSKILIKKVLHPGACVRGFYTINESFHNWKRLNLQEYF